MPDDLRIKILRYFIDKKTSTEEHPSNEWLANQHNDLGTLRRALLELIDNEFLVISNKNKKDSLQKIQTEFNTGALQFSNPLSSLDEMRKSSKRLTNNLRNFNRIPDIKFITTVKGLKFIIEFDKLKVDATLSHRRKIWFWPIAISGLVSLAITLLKSAIDFF